MAGDQGCNPGHVPAPPSPQNKLPADHFNAGGPVKPFHLHEYTCHTWLEGKDEVAKSGGVTQPCWPAASEQNPSRSLARAHCYCYWPHCVLKLTVKVLCGFRLTMRSSGPGLMPSLPLRRLPGGSAMSPVSPPLPSFQPSTPPHPCCPPATLRCSR